MACSRGGGCLGVLDGLQLALQRRFALAQPGPRGAERDGAGVGVAGKQDQVCRQAQHAHEADAQRGLGGKTPPVQRHHQRRPGGCGCQCLQHPLERPERSHVDAAANDQGENNPQRKTERCGPQTETEVVQQQIVDFRRQRIPGVAGPQINHMRINQKLQHHEPPCPGAMTVLQKVNRKNRNEDQPGHAAIAVVHANDPVGWRSRFGGHGAGAAVAKNGRPQTGAKKPPPPQSHHAQEQPLSCKCNNNFWGRSSSLDLIRRAAPVPPISASGLSTPPCAAATAHRVRARA